MGGRAGERPGSGSALGQSELGQGEGKGPQVPSRAGGGQVGKWGKTPVVAGSGGEVGSA